MMKSTYEMIQKKTKKLPSSVNSLTEIREALRNNNYKDFKKRIEAIDQKLLDSLLHPDNKTCLEIAICESGKEEFVKLLLEHDVNINKINEYDDVAPIHLAIQTVNIPVLKLLLKHKNIDIDNKMKGLNTPLLLAIKNIHDDRRNFAEHEEMIKLLLENGCDVNGFDINGLTPLMCASKKSLVKVVELILENGKNRVDLDMLKDENGKTARQLITETFPHLVLNLPKKQDICKTTDPNKLWVYLNNEDEKNFIHDFTDLVNKNEHHGVFSVTTRQNTILELATEKGLESVVEILLNNGANPNDTCANYPKRPIAIACRNGFVNILEKYINHKSISLQPVNGHSLLQITINGMKTHDLKDNKVRNHRKCLEILLQTNKIDVNYKDAKKNTALHYAVRNRDDITVLLLLNRGAFIGIKNEYGITPLPDIKAETLEAHLNNCIKIKEKSSDSEKQEIHIDFHSLVYSNKLDNNEDADLDLENSRKKALFVKNNDTETNETDAFLYMAMNKNMKHLLKHPVIASILSLKRQRISIFFYANISFYFLLCLCLVLYIFIEYGVHKKEPDTRISSITSFRLGTIIGVVLLTLRELFQILVTPESYFKSIQNWMEIGLISVTFCISFFDFANESTKKQLCAVAILLSSVELVFLLSFIPTFSIYIVMLMRVSKHFLTLLIWYCVVIIAFGLSFSTLFRTSTEENVANDCCSIANNCTDKNFFQDWSTSIFKTIVMVTGEFDISSIDFDATPVTSHILFILFIFLVPIVLSNLLIGLAVNDIQKIREEAEIESQILLLETISYLENLFVAKSIISTKNCALPSCLKYLHANRSKLFFIRPLAKRINLFPNFIPQYKIVIEPYNNNRIEIPGNASTIDMCACNILHYCKRGQCYSLDKNIIQNAKNIHSQNNDVDIRNITKYVKQNNERLQNVENKLNSLCDQINVHSNEIISKNTSP